MVRAMVCAMLALSVGRSGDVLGQTVTGEWRDIASLARRVIDAGLTPGAAIAVAVGDRVAWVEGFGAADLVTGRPVTSETQFYIASTTKALTATAAAVAAHRGELDLDSPMVGYLPDARLPDGVEPGSITVRDLIGLTHGLAGDGPITLRTAFTGEFTRAELLELVRYHRPTGRHGSFDYNNLGYNLLGMVLEAVYDESWQDVVKHLVLEPLGMTSTSAHRSRLDPNRLAMPHDLGVGGFTVVTLVKEDANMHAAGGHFTSAPDLARFIAVHQSGGIVDGLERLPRQALALTHRMHVRQDRQFGPVHRFGWGLGWDLGTYEGDTIIHRFGAFGGHRSHMSFMPRHGIGVVVLVNGDASAGPAADLMATYVYDRLLGKPDVEERFAARLDTLSYLLGVRRRQIARHLEERAARQAPLRHPLADFAGTYVSPILGRMQWRVVAEGLEVRIGVLQSPAEVYDAPTDHLRIEFAGTGAVAAFEFPRGGGPARAVTVLGFRFERLERTPDQDT